MLKTDVSNLLTGHLHAALILLISIFI